MGNKIIDYRVLVRDRLRGLRGEYGIEDDVKEMLEEGWEPLGGVVASPMDGFKQ